jgi:hypothetical protein
VNKLILNWHRPLWEGDQEVVKRSGRDEPVWVVVYMCIEATLEISLYSCLYLKLAKTLSFLLSLMFSLQKIREQEGRTGSAWKWVWRDVRWLKQCIHM